jgi:hypothetical protein
MYIIKRQQHVKAVFDDSMTTIDAQKSQGKVWHMHNMRMIN